MKCLNFALLFLVFCHLVSANDFLDAVKAGNLEAIQQHLSSGLNAKTLDERGYNALHWAAFWGQTEVVDFLINEGHVEDINAGGHDGVTALHLAVGGGHGATVTRLLEGGATVTATDVNDLTPYHTAMGRGYDTIAAQLLEAAPGQNQGGVGVHGAARRVYIYAVERMLAYPDRDLSNVQWANLLHTYQHAEDLQAVAILEAAGLGTVEGDETDDSDSDSSDDDDGSEIVDSDSDADDGSEIVDSDSETDDEGDGGNANPVLVIQPQDGPAFVVPLPDFLPRLLAVRLLMVMAGIQDGYRAPWR